MENTYKGSELYLLVDIDDLLVRSSDKLQDTLDKKTNFKTNILRMLEQLNRNCRYFKDQVKEEINTAWKEGRKPYLERFGVFDNMTFNSDEEWYTRPLDAPEYYLNVADMLLNQFLEERDTFLEIDNMPYGEIKSFNYRMEIETILKYTELINKNKDAFHKINSFCLKQARELIDSATIMNKDNILNVPNYGALVSMDTNDVLKGNSLLNSESIEYKKYILYQKPLEDIENCISLENHLYDIITNAIVFITPSHEIINYEEIHNESNVNWEAVRLVEELIHSHLFKEVYFSTHHNGNREEQAKMHLMRRIIPEASGFIGQRFHDVEHNAARRGRSSKIDRALDYLRIRPEQIVLFDDSKANCGDCKEKLGTEILYKPQTDSEIIKGELEDTRYNRILSFDNRHIYDFIAKAYDKPKIKVKK